MLCMFQGTMAPGQHPKSRYQVIAGGLAGIVSWVIAMPLDVIKSRIQADNLTNPKYKGMYDCFLKSYHEFGPSIFMKGICATTLRAFPTNSITFLVFQYCMDSCEDFFVTVFPENKEKTKSK
uniref:Solute carrier family 25 member 45 isoform x2 n=1 Tax=Triatoma infestans TaxID=30076 RepID=A0A161MGZ3_TRIIF